MAAAPPSVVLAAARWLFELRVSSRERAYVALTTEPRYRNLTTTQYSAAYRWITDRGLLTLAAALPSDDVTRWHRACHVAFEAAVLSDVPPWLAEGAALVASVDELPLPVAELANILDLSPPDAFAAVRAAAGKVDVAVRERVGRAAEVALTAVLRAEVAGHVDHVALTQDGLGYDIAVTTAEHAAHLEVKGTTRRSALSLFLSRNEYEVMRADPAWLLSAVLVDSAEEDASIVTVATVARDWIAAAVPVDRAAGGRWESVRLTVPRGALTGGIPALIPSARPGAAFLFTGGAPESLPEWLR